MSDGREPVPLGARHAAAPTSYCSGHNATWPTAPSPVSAGSRLKRGTPRDIVRTIMRSFIPVDDESRDAMLMYVALFTAALLDPVLKRKEAAEVPASMRRVFTEQLRRARLRAGVDPQREALILLVVVTGLSQGVLDGQITPADAFDAIDYSLNRALRA
jgi:hypothetical protein